MNGQRRGTCTRNLGEDHEYEDGIDEEAERGKRVKGLKGKVVSMRPEWHTRGLVGERKGSESPRRLRLELHPRFRTFFFCSFYRCILR